MPIVRLAAHPDYHLKAGEPDLTRYMVLSQQGETLGDVVDLIADTSAMRLRYLVVSLCHPEGVRKIVPLSAVHLDDTTQTATCVGEACTEPNLARFPTDTGGDITEAILPPGNETAPQPDWIVPLTYAISRRMPHLAEAADAMVDSAKAHAEREHARGIRHPGDEAA